MQVVSSRDMETRRGPEEWFTGDVWLDSTSIPSPGAGFFRVLSEPGARTNWHMHSGPQWLFVVEGRIRAQVWGAPWQDVDTGDAVVFAPGEKHWHGAVPGGSGTHLAVNVDAKTEWLEAVTDEQYEG